ncbi:nucleoredoxin-like [Dysidea avara]|uniref:nucleoredoxin-like n=1 Tax=Dysidea avara TaxID=196820 RepID=UPI0033293CAD
MAVSSLLGDTVIKKISGDKVEEAATATFSGAGKVVGLYFSAHWCPPCRAFTPKLAEWYNKIKSGSNAENFDIVFLSSDRDEGSFREYFNEMPWHAVSFSDKATKTNLSRKFKVSGIPTLILLDGETGAVLTADGRSIVAEDPEGTQFPWKPKPLSELIGEEFVTTGLKEVGKEAIEGKVLGLYFSAHWCGPCRGFTPQLVESYNKLKQAGKNFEIIFCSSDRDDKSFKDYFGTMPWISLPYNDPRKKALSRHFDVSGIPTLVIVDEERKLVTTQGRAAVSNDADGKEFPWYPKPLNKLTGATAGQINDSPSLILFTNGEQEEMDKAMKVIEPVAKEYIEKWKKENKEQEVYFFYAGTGDGSDDDIVQSLRQFANLADTTPLLTIIDIPEQTVYVSDTTDMTEALIREYLSKYLAKTLDGKPLRST